MAGQARFALTLVALAALLIAGLLGYVYALAIVTDDAAPTLHAHPAPLPGLPHSEFSAATLPTE